MIFFTSSIEIPALLFWLMTFTIAGLLLILYSTLHRRDPDYDIEHPENLLDARYSITGLTHSASKRGNRVTLLQDTDYFDALIGAIEGARGSVNFETYLWEEGKVSDRVTDALARSARNGVDVRMMLDGSGGSMTQEQKQRLLEAGVALASYHPFRLSNLGKINNRDHRKICVVDGRIGFVGGHCFTDDWVEGRKGKPAFRDITARIEGPVVHDIQSTFSENWVEETGDVFIGDAYFPKLERVGEVEAHVTWITPAGIPSAVKLLHYLAITCATKRVWIQNPYFLPDPDGIDALIEAVDRGVDVRVMVPATSVTDHPIVQHAGHHKFGAMLDGGIRIFEYERTLLHQKVLTVDGTWAAVGSTNFDDRSFEINDEITVGFWDEGVAKELEQTFERDLEHCTEMNAREWRKRGFRHRLIDGTFFIINEQL